jgi:hypothetical protein
LGELRCINASTGRAMGNGFTPAELMEIPNEDSN